MEVIYCERCHKAKPVPASYENVKDQIEEILKVRPIDFCMSYCGPGEYKHFITVDDEIIEGDTFDELIERVKEFSEHS